MVGADRAVTAPRVIDHRQARRLMFVEFPACIIHWLILVATRGRRFHDLPNAHFRALATATHFLLLNLTSVSTFVLLTVGFDLVNRRFTTALTA